MTTEDFNIFVTTVSKEIAEGKIANEEGVFLKRAIAQGFELDKEETKLLKIMKYKPKRDI